MGFRRKTIDSSRGTLNLGPMKISTVRILALIALLACTGLTACSTPAKTAENKDKEEEYVYVTVTGSNIPKKIKKSDIAAGKVPADVQAQLVDKEQFEKSLRPGVSNNK